MKKERQGFVTNLELKTFENIHFCQVLFTGEHIQLTLMSIGPNDDIGPTIHPDSEQVVRIKSGHGRLLIGKKEFCVNGEYVALIPAGLPYNIINLSRSGPMQIYALHAPPYYPPDVTYETKLDALKANITAAQKKPHFHKHS